VRDFSNRRLDVSPRQRLPWNYEEEAEKAAGSPSDGLSGNCLPTVDSFLALCLAPPKEVLAVFNELRHLTLAS
jgi:hypothetical protein